MIPVRDILEIDQVFSLMEIIRLKIRLLSSKRKLIKTIIVVLDHMFQERILSQKNEGFEI